MMSFCSSSRMHHSITTQGQSQSNNNRRRQELHQHHHAPHAKGTTEAKFQETAATTCHRCNRKPLVHFGILLMSLLCLDINEVLSSSSFTTTIRRRSLYYYCHAFQPGSASTSFHHARKRRSSSSFWGHQPLSRRPVKTNRSSSSSVEEDSLDEDEALLLQSDGSFVKETFQERYGSSSSSSVLPDWLIQKCAECGWIHPTRIQQRALDVICFDKRDAIIQAETGSGKTLAYLLPGLACIDPSRATVQALIVVPTRELGLQVARVAKRLAASSSSSSSSTVENETDETGDSNNSSIGRDDKIMVMNVLQGSQNRRQRAWAWAEPPHLIIGTPQELCDMVRFGGIKRYNSVKYVVVDEVDACLLNNGVGSTSLTASLSSSTTLLHQLLSKYLSPTFNDGSSNGDENNGSVSSSTTSSILNAKSTNGQSARPVSRQRQTIFASATIPQHRHFLKQVVQNKWTLNHQPPVHVCLRSSNSGGDGGGGGGGEQLIPRQIQHAYIVVSPSTSRDENTQNKFTALRSVLKKIFKSNRQDDTSTTMAKKVLIFAENQRPLESMAERLAFDFEKTGSMYWTESSLLHSPEYDRARAIFAVLRFEDSLSQRSAAMDCLRGEEDQQQAWQSRTTRRRQQQQQQQDQQDSVPESNSTDSISSAPEATAATATTAHQQSPVLRVLLSSDLASRGVDIPDLTHVIQFDLPPNADSYVHRAGRTGRLNKSGQVLSIITPEQEFVLQRLANKLNIDIRCLARQ